MPPLLQRGGSSFLLFRDAKGMVESTHFGRMGADYPWSTPEVGEVAQGRSPDTQPSAVSRGSPQLAQVDRDSVHPQRSGSGLPEAVAAEASVEEVERLFGDMQCWERAIRIRTR